MGFRVDNSKEYLVLPYFKGAEEREVKFFDEKGSLLTSLILEFKGDGNREVYLPSSLFSPSLYIEGPEELEALVKTSDELPSFSPHFSYHYAPRFGWINDPNGMHLKDGVYHLYYQHNPVSEKWNNMSWGHAVSDDMVEFREEKPVFLPKDDKWVIFSGSALGDEFVYTVANVKGDRAFYQERRYSSDGYSFSKPDTIIPNVYEDERDPRIFTYKGETYILLWLKEDLFGLYRKEGENYSLLSSFRAKDGWECPDILFVGDRLFFTSADGTYFDCEMKDDGLHLTGSGKKMFLTSLPYASQSFTGTEGTYLISWLRALTPDLESTGVMSMVRKVGFMDGVLTLKPIDALMDRFHETRRVNDEYSSSEEALYLKSEGSFKGTLSSRLFSYDKESGMLEYGEEKVDMGKDQSLEIFIDHEITEISTSDWKKLASFENPGKKNYDVKINLNLNGTVLREFIWR